MRDMTVDAVRSDRETSSAQASNPDQSNGFTAYHSPLLSYPLLRSHSPPRVRDTNSLAEPSHPSQTPDLSTLFPVSLSSCKAAAVNRWLSDPSRRICQYEVPGGGECRDPGCEDIHPSRAGSVEPSGAPLSPCLPALMSLSLARRLPSLCPHRRCYRTQIVRCATQGIGGHSGATRRGAARLSTAISWV
ncbi:hypothetical protein PHLGIDRAFT_26369 [Phlebiopsis gigantea 11061_1 CR5-6]|uniref:Zinc-finger domain-containing protein n=1 Tax=Phlebiopsis gigantea (strain 11061_1 CR5-6) TaxID=745531 RepID=A0A0C3PCN0_PHLG1|nr:hypothetical protein PHLGIDRAFT_26369 [Phlebiopsis gigantea 11061_1 CR5-6]